ncbi:MAG TPA: alpha-mannosidase [Cyanobacteria bacterium UBA9273]|nr:alpha-mannosidase [Cyanobacteria bacterium UBA9273]
MGLLSSEFLSLSASIERLRALTQVNVQSNWQYCERDLPLELVESGIALDWSRVELNAKGYITWSAGQQVRWLGQRFIVPYDLQGYPLAGLALRLVLTWWAAEVKVFVNGRLVQEGDLFDSTARVLLSAAVVPGEEIIVMLRLVSPGHDIGALMRSHCIYESTNSIEPGFVADELTVLQQYLAAFAPEQLDTLAAAVTEIDWEAVSQQGKFERSLSRLRQTLLSQIPTPQSKINLLGHAHLDMAWLWPLSETWTVAQRTFESVLNLQQDFPELIFCHSTPALYAWIEQHRPDLFARIKQQIALGRWEVVGGMWVEPELNLIGGESIVRQILYAQRYVREKFGELTRVAWVPDSFGFGWQLPQILKQGGIEYFVTQKLHWNDTTKFPYGVFWWQSPDGSQILSLISPPNVTGVMDTNPVTMASYAIDWEIQTQLPEALWLPGVGDHGGGPTRDMLQVARRWQQSPFFPRLEFTTALKYLQHIQHNKLVEAGLDDNPVGIVGAGLGDNPVGKQVTSQPNPPSTPESNSLPIWNDELYLEFHRGCYTTHADQKRWNRYCEGLLYQAELCASLATLTTGAAYPKTQLETAWQKVLFNQFHDILPGTSIPEVFVEANQTWQEVAQVGREIVQASLSAIASQIALPPPPHPDAQPIIIFNPLNWQRSEVVAVSLPGERLEVISLDWAIYDLAGTKIPSQLSAESTLLFLAQDIPSVGYRVYWLCPGVSGISVECELESLNPPLDQVATPFVLENDLLRVAIDADTGDLSSVFDKIQQREVLKGAGNQLQAFQDSGQYWDAWNIDPNYTQYPLPPTQLVSIEWLEVGVWRSRLRVVRQLAASQFCQDYMLTYGSPVLQIATTVDWQESHVLIKAAFPLNLETNWATYEIACGAIQRPTQPQTPALQAKWEVPALRWADLTDQGYGVSLLNDCKYGYDAQCDRVSLTLLRGSCWPDPEADRGIHHFTYALYPHSGSWQSARTVHRGYELNLPLQVLVCPALNPDRPQLLPPRGKLLDLQAENAILMALKPAEDIPNQWIVRCYECHGYPADLTLNSDVGLSIAYPVDLLENPGHSESDSSTGQTFRIAPWKIASFAVVRTT